MTPIEAPMGDIGPAEVIFGGTSIGENQNVMFNAGDDTAPVKTAKFGTADKDRVFTGRNCTVTVMMTQSSLTQLGLVTIGSATSGTEMTVSNTAGTSMRTNSGILILKPIVDGAVTADVTRWITVFIAAPLLDHDVVFDGEGGQRYFKVEFRGFPVDEADVPTSGLTIGDLYSFGGNA